MLKPFLPRVKTSPNVSNSPPLPEIFHPLPAPNQPNFPLVFENYVISGVYQKISSTPLEKGESLL